MYAGAPHVWRHTANRLQTSILRGTFEHTVTSTAVRAPTKETVKTDDAAALLNPSLNDTTEHCAPLNCGLDVHNQYDRDYHHRCRRAKIVNEFHHHHHRHQFTSIPLTVISRFHSRSFPEPAARSQTSHHHNHRRCHLRQYQHQTKKLSAPSSSRYYSTLSLPVHAQRTSSERRSLLIVSHLPIQHCPQWVPRVWKTHVAARATLPGEKT